MIYTALNDLQNDLLEGKTNVTEQLAGYLENISDRKELNAFVEVFEDTAREQAKALDAKIKSGATVGKLFGLIIGIKDNISYKGQLLTASSEILDGYRAVYSATVVERLLQEDAIIIGRLNCDEFAMGSSNENSCYGPVLNPVDESRVPGGSSGGSAAAVQANLCLATLGSDTGGSIRQPAAFCGVIGLKPTYGRVSRYGLIAYGSSFDQIGPITNNVDDAARILSVIAGKDDYDSTVSSKDVPSYHEMLNSDKKFRIAYYEEAVNHESIDKDIRDCSMSLIEELRSCGHTVEPIHFSEIDYIVPAYYVLTAAEASSNLARFDGIRYGHRFMDAENMEQTYKKTRSHGFGKEVQRRIMSGTFVLSSGYYDAYYSKAQKVRRILADKTQETLREYDFIMCPAAPSTAYKIGEKTTDPISMYLGDIFTVQANLVGIPAISLPIGEDQNRLPIGIQFMAGKFEEAKLLAFSEQIMRNKQNLN